MKLKYFLRGLGFGILVTVAVFLISQKLEGDQSYISDQEIMERAAILGMVKEEDRKEMSPEPASSPNPEEPIPTEKSSKEPKPESTKDTTENKTPEPVKDKPEEPEETQEPEYISITIEKGMWSEAVSEKLKEVGLIESVEEFNRYLTDNDYSNYIFAGTYQIEKDAAYEDIAKKITGN